MVISHIRRERKPTASIHDAVLEPIVPPAAECFVWRTDDYPLPWSVWNMHPECEIHLINGAGGTCHVGDHIGSFEDGDLFFIGRGLPHNWVTPLAQGDKVAGRDIIIQFDEDRLLQASTWVPEFADLAEFFVLARRGFSFGGDARKQGGALVAEIGTHRGVERLAVFLKLLNVLSNSSERTPLSSESFVPNADVSKHDTVRNILAWISANFDSDVRLAQLADMVGMTESSFSRFFKKNTGTTFVRYLSELRMAKACELLLRSDRAVTEIAQDVGYDNLSNFNKTFRTLRGMPPTGYRRLRQGM